MTTAIERRIQNEIGNQENRRQIPNFEIYGQREVDTFKYTVSFHVGQLLNCNEEDFIRGLIKLRIMENVELCQKVGAQVHLTVKTMELKKRLLTDGLIFNGGRIKFRDPATRVLSITMIDCPPCYTIRDLTELMGDFRPIHQVYEVTKTVDNVTYKNGNRVFQYRQLTQLPPKRFTIDVHMVRLVYSDPSPSMLSEDLRRRLSDWGQGTKLTVWGGHNGRW